MGDSARVLHKKGPPCFLLHDVAWNIERRCVDMHVSGMYSVSLVYLSCVQCVSSVSLVCRTWSRCPPGW